MRSETGAAYRLICRTPNAKIKKFAYFCTNTEKRTGAAAHRAHPVTANTLPPDMVTPGNIHAIPRIDYHSLMQRRIRKILLICSSYDAYILEEDGRIESQINKEYIDLNLSNPPSFSRVASTTEALARLETESDFDVVISMYNVGELDVFSFSKQLKAHHPHIPLVLLTNLSREIYRRIDSEDHSAIDYIFSWHGNADLIIAIIKTIEDRMNADNDILEVGVQSILLVEDSIKYYSTYLPAVYKLVLQQSNEFLKEALNEQQQTLRKRARPKILLATNYTEAVELYEKYKKHMLGVISDVGFVIHKNDRSEDEKFDAGIDLCKLIKKDDPHMPFLLQSSQESMRATAEELGVGFIVGFLVYQVGTLITTGAPCASRYCSSVQRPFSS